MSVKQSLLAILDLGPCYGYQLRSEFDRRTGATWPLNVGQIYNTLDRLERDGLVEKDAVDAQGHVYWRITDAGSAAVREWLDTPVDAPAVTRDELAVKVSLAATLPGADATAIVRAQRVASTARLRGLSREPLGSPADPAELAGALISDALVCAAEAELHWLDRVEERLAQHPGSSLPLAPTSQRPRRGRPVRS
ncbi:PadR family transcriptional regulator [Microbacterium sp. CJ88]|uniref:PadR family transcriptional regulator n=1 Tax=Microbacterium sp. CJ88 TaxID=3445672 RepID=UPI003F65A322